MFNLPKEMLYLIWKFDDTVKNNYNKVVRQLNKYIEYKKSYSKVLYCLTKFPHYTHSNYNTHYFEIIYNFSRHSSGLPPLTLVDNFSVRGKYKKSFIISAKAHSKNNTFLYYT